MSPSPDEPVVSRFANVLAKRQQPALDVQHGCHDGPFRRSGQIEVFWRSGYDFLMGKLRETSEMHVQSAIANAGLAREEHDLEKKIDYLACAIEELAKAMAADPPTVIKMVERLAPPE